MGKEAVHNGTFFANTAEAVQLTMRVMESSVGSADAAYLFAHTPANMWPVILKGNEIYRNNGVKKLVILGLAKKKMRTEPDGKMAPDYGTPAMADSDLAEEKPIIIHSGCRDWKERLCFYGVKEEDIVISELADPVYTGPAYNTHTEAVGFVQMAKVRGWRYLLVVSPDWHIMRATAEVVTAALNYYPEVEIFTGRGGIFEGDWDGKATLQSQSDAKPKPRMDSLADEIAKMDTYYRQGDSDLRCAREILEYFKMRDQRCREAWKKRLDYLAMD